MERIIASRDSTILAALIQHGLKKKTAQKRIADGSIRLNGRVVARANVPVEAEDIIEFGPRESTPRLPFGLQLLHEDEHIIVVDKPEGLLSVPSARERERCVEHALNTSLHVRCARVHRIDRDTSGVLCFAKSKSAAQTLIDSWSRCQKKYIAIVSAVPEPREGVVDQALRETKSLDVVVDARGERALTRYRTQATRPPYARVEVEIETGKKHQIRVHLAHLGAPVVGDERYGGTVHPRLMLHARELVLADGQSFKAAVPRGFDRLVRA